MFNIGHQKLHNFNAYADQYIKDTGIDRDSYDIIVAPANKPVAITPNNTGEERVKNLFEQVSGTTAYTWLV